jgi:hypothetical protein
MALIKTQKSFGEQLNDIQSVFQAAKTKANALADAMTTEKANKEAQVAKLQEEINVISEVEVRNKQFVERLESFIG